MARGWWSARAVERAEHGNSPRKASVMAWFMLLMVLSFPVVIQAQAVPVTMRGVGGISCGTWMESQDSPQYRYQITEWIFGFLSGINWETANTQVRIPERAVVVAFLDHYCHNHPDKLISSGAAALHRALDSERDKEPPSTLR